MDQDLGLPPVEGLLDLGKARHHLGGLGRHGQRLDGATDQQVFGIGGQALRGADVALEPPAELVTPHRFRNPGP